MLDKLNKQLSSNDKSVVNLTFLVFIASVPVTQFHLCKDSCENERNV